MDFFDAKTNLQDSVRAKDLIDAHRRVVEFYEPEMDVREECARFVAGKQWSDNELATMKKKKKIPVVFNFLKENERTIRGMFQQNKYDCKFSPVGSEDQDISDMLNTRYSWESKKLGFDRDDLKMVTQAWCGGTANMEIYVCIYDDKIKIHSEIQNPFAVFWDPNSMDPGRRRDAEFYDRISWMSAETLETSFPDLDFSALKNVSNDYEQIEKEADRASDNQITRNGQHKVIERYYKVRVSEFYHKDNDKKIPIGGKEERQKFKQQFPSKPIFTKEKEVLFLACVCENFSTDEYLYNGPAFSQLTNPEDDSIIWPMVELVAEDINGKPQGFVEHLIGPQRLFNANMSNIYHASRHSANTSYGLKQSMFASDKEARKAADHHSDGDQIFQLNETADGSFMMPIQATQAAPDNGNAINLTLSAIERISSTPPSMKGISEGATSGILNQQRIEQSYVQLSGFVSNFRDFCERRAKVIYAIWREYNQYYINETIRLTKKDAPITINQPQPVLNAAGEETGAVQFLNDPTVGYYDVTFEDSTKSSAYRTKVMAQTNEIFQSQAFSVIAQQNPAMAMELARTWIESGDIAQDTKDKLNKLVDDAAQSAQQAQQAQAQQAQEQAALAMEGQKAQVSKVAHEAEEKRLSAQRKLQEIADAEASSTVPTFGTQQPLKP